MKRLLATLAPVALLGALLAAQQPPLVPAVKEAALSGDFPLAQRILTAAKRQGTNPEVLEAESWLGRAQLARKNYAEAAKNAEEVRTECLALLKNRKLDAEPHLPIALGATIEVTGQSLAAQGSRDQAVAFLRAEVQRWKGTSITARIQKNLNLLTLEGKPAPALEVAASIGKVKPQSLTALKGHPVVLFFWAHWCSDCKAEALDMAKLAATYGPKGLRIVAPTQHYGYVAAGEEAQRPAETKYIGTIWNQYYPALQAAAVPLSENNFLAYGVSTTPTLVIVDKQGIVRLYNPGNLTYEQLAARVEKLL